MPHSEEKQHIIDLVQVQASSCPVHGQITPCSYCCLSLCLTAASQQLSLWGFSQAEFCPASRLWAKHSITYYTTAAERGGMQIGAPRDTLGNLAQLDTWGIKWKSTGDKSLLAIYLPQALGNNQVQCSKWFQHTYLKIKSCALDYNEALERSSLYFAVSHLQANISTANLNL